MKPKPKENRDTQAFEETMNELRQLVQELMQQYGMEPKEIRTMVEDMMKTMAKTASGT